MRILYRIFPPNIGKINEKNINTLSRYLKHGNTITRVNAAYALSQMKSDRIPTILKHGLNDKSLSVRAHAAIGLAKYSIPQMDGYLMNAIKSKIPQVRRDSAKYLRNYPNDNVINTLIDLLNDNDPQVIVNALYSLCEIQNKKAINPIINLIRQIIDSSSSPYLIIKDDTYNTSLWALENIGNTEACGFLIELLKDIGDLKILSSLKKLMNHDDFKDLLINQLRTGVNIEVRNACLGELEIINWKPENIDDRIYYYIIHNQYSKIEKLGNTSVEYLIEIILEFIKIIEKRYTKEFYIKASELVELLGQLKYKDSSYFLFNLYPIAIKIEKQYGGSLLSYNIEQVYRVFENKNIHLEVLSIEELVIKCKDKNTSVRLAAAISLENRGWKPKTINNQVYYYVAKGYWDKILEIKERPINALLETFKYTDLTTDTFIEFGKPGLDALIKTIDNEKVSIDHKSNLINVLLKYEPELTINHIKRLQCKDVDYQIRQRLFQALKSFYQTVSVSKVNIPIRCYTIDDENERIEIILKLLDNYNPYNIDALLNFIFLTDYNSNWDFTPKSWGNPPITMNLKISENKLIRDAIKKQLKDYAKYIFSLSNVVFKDKISKGKWDIYDTYFDEKNNSTLIDLCELNTEISSNILTLISIRKNIHNSENTDMDTEHHYVYSFKHQRDIAFKELMNRGCPTYNTDYYCNPNNWKINMNENKSE